MKPIERVSEHDDKERGLIAFRLNEAPFRISFASPFRKDDIILVKPFKDTLKPEITYSGIYLSKIYKNGYVLEKMCEVAPDGWRESDGIDYAILLAGYKHTTPFDDLIIIGEFFEIKDDRPIECIQSGFVKGNPFKRLNYHFQGHHTKKHYQRFMDICNGKTAIDEDVVSIFKKA